MDLRRQPIFLLFGALPDEKQLEEFKELLANQRSLPRNFVRDVIMKAPGRDIMNALSRSVLTLYSYDNNPDDISLPNVLRQCLNLISIFPLLSVYGYQAYNHYVRGKSLYIHNPKKELSTAENILRMLRPDKKYTDLEAKILDLALILHMEHGGGNNSTFTTHVVSSSGTDTYSAIAAALGSLKGPKHGGANIKVIQMFQDMKKEVKDWEDEDEVREYLKRLLHKEAFDKRGLIYGMGHAIYSVSDPRAQVLRRLCRKPCQRKRTYEGLQTVTPMVEWMAPQVIAEERRDLQGRQCQRGLLQRFCLQYAGSSAGVIHTDVCSGTYRRMECTSYGGVDQYRQDYSSCIQKCSACCRICAS